MERSNIIFQLPSPASICVDESSDINEIFTKYNHFLASSNIWHRFEVTNIGNMHRNVILKTILDYMSPLELIPVCYAKDKNAEKCFFLARRCKTAIRKLASNDFMVEYPDTKKTGVKQSFFKIRVVLNFSNTEEFTVDILTNVLMVLQKRMKYPEKYLDLDNFADDPDLTEYCPLSQPRIALFVLNVAKTLRPLGIILSNNDLTKICNRFVFNSELRKLDLSHNQIQSFNSMVLKHLNITDLTLTGNPLCNCDQETYVKNALEACPRLELLDGISLRRGEFPTVQKNFLCSIDGYDLVNQFLQHFFTVYDSGDRSTLLKLYNPLAVFSCATSPSGVYSASLDRYHALSRNLMKTAEDGSKSKSIYNGIFEIYNLFANNIPLTQHDPYSFTADLVYRTNKCSILSVTGVFREPSNSDVLGFMRTFVLDHSYDESKCSILNDQLNVYKVPVFRESQYFVTPHSMSDPLKEIQLLPQKESDTQDLVRTLCRITSLREDWARQCLENCHFHLKTALEFFVSLYQEDKFPKHAFVK
ncbi:hypothetical protein GWI33_006180 [Rhynchophorus ferrugineus]|uniref:Uncharacterized protein n=1 Tax=Rhynchophorus ferrugineus TaxID=354439 RepID=A0A834ILW7_RHYFE|nr:hypothetical protein GWI33_006180 [Rhynchophorus ferrugineus]